MGADGLTPGAVISPIERQVLDGTDRNWHAKTATAVDHLIFDPRLQTEFYVYPGVGATPVWVEAQFAISPPAIPAPSPEGIYARAALSTAGCTSATNTSTSCGPTCCPRLFRTPRTRPAPPWRQPRFFVPEQSEPDGASRHREQSQLDDAAVRAGSSGDGPVSSGMATTDDFLPGILPDVPGCPLPTVRFHVHRAVMEFCRESGIWYEDLTPIDPRERLQRDYVPPVTPA